MNNRIRITSANGVYDPRTGRYYSEVVTSENNSKFIDNLDTNGNGYRQEGIIPVERPDPIAERITEVETTLEDAILELAQNQADLEDAIVELAQMITEE